MKLKIVYITLLFLFNWSLVLAQSTGNTIFANPDEEYVLSKDSLKVKDKIHYNFEMGVNIGSGGNFGTFYKPSVIYEFTPKFRIHTGVMYTKSNLNNYPVYKDYT